MALGTPSLPERPAISAEARARLAADFERFADDPLGERLSAWARERWRVDLGGRYAGRDVRTAIGKASGQLSMTPGQVEADARADVGFVVLKTVIAEDADGERGMHAWAIHESQMKVERITDDRGTVGWTVTWRGRGWDRSFAEYRDLLTAALAIGDRHGVVIAPSVKYHLPSLDDEPFRAGEYRYTTGALLDTWRAAGRREPMPLEKDFSPTLAADARAGRREIVVRWLREVPVLIRAGGRGEVKVGIKLMNARFDDAFQVAMLRQGDGADFLVGFNRLFDYRRGVAYGGPALSSRNMRVLDMCLDAYGAPPSELSATGDIDSGRRIVEYALRGATSVQLHTFFQLPRAEYRSSATSRSMAAMHELVLHPEKGLLAWMLHASEQGWIGPRDGMLRFVDLAGAARRAGGQ